MTYDAQCRLVDAKTKLEWALSTGNGDTVAMVVNDYRTEILTALQERIKNEVYATKSA